MFQRRTGRSVAIAVLLAALGAVVPAKADFLVSVSVNSGAVNEVQRYTDNGSYVGVFASGGGLSTPEGLAYGPDGNLYVMSYANGCILRYDGTTGSFIDCVTNDPSGANTGVGLHFGPDGNMYVTNYNSNNIQAYNVNTNTWSTFATGGNLNGPLDFTFLPDGSMVVSNSNTDSILHYSSTGTYLGTFVAAGDHGLSFPDGLTVHNGVLFVSSSGSNQVYMYNATTGAYVGNFVSTGLNTDPIGLLFQPNGNLLVATNYTGEIHQYDPSGSLVGTFGFAQMGGAGTPGYPTYMVAYVPEPSSLVLAGLGASALIGLAWRRRFNEEAAASA